MSGHLKRLVVPKTWHIPKKVNIWAQRPNCGGYPLSGSISLTTIIRDYLKYADSSKEAKKIIHSGKIMVDGVIRKDPKFGVGLMTVISISPRKEHLRVMLNEQGRLELLKISAPESAKKLCKIVGKKFVKGGLTQLQFHDGRTLLLDTPNGYQVSDSLLLEIPTQKILGHIALKSGSLALITQGHNIGKICTLKEIQETKDSSTHVAVLNDKNKGEIRTLKEYLFFVGEKKPQLTLR